MKLEGACERLGRNACEKLGNAIAETATAITESHMANLTANPTDIRSITENQMTITANPNLAMVIQRSFPG